jgi:hypothetical protein
MRRPYLLAPKFTHPSSPDFKDQQELAEMDVMAALAAIPLTNEYEDGLDGLKEEVLVSVLRAPWPGYTGDYGRNYGAMLAFQEWLGQGHGREDEQDDRREDEQHDGYDASDQEDGYDAAVEAREVLARVSERLSYAVADYDAAIARNDVALAARMKANQAVALFHLARENKPGWRQPSLAWRPVRMHFGSTMLSSLQERPAEIIPGVVGAGLITVLAGDKSTGKSAILSSMACCILTGEPWLPAGAPTKQGRVLIIATEGYHRSIHDFAAQCISRGLDPAEVMDRGFAVVQGAFHLDTPHGITALRNVLDEFRDAFGGYPDLLAIDTVRKSMRGSVSEERDVAAFIRNLEEEIAPLDVAVMLLAHTSKDTRDSSTKGSNDWENGADYVLRITGKVREKKTSILFEKVKTGSDGHGVKVDFVTQNVPDAGETIVAMPRPIKPVLEPEAQNASARSGKGA